MRKLQVGGFSLLENIHRSGFRRYRIFALTIITLTILSMTWTYSDFIARGYELQSSETSKYNTNTSGTSRDQLGFWWARHAATNSIQSIPPKNESAVGSVLDLKKLEMTASWLSMNTDYAYILIGKDGANEFVKLHSADEPSIVEAYNKAPNVGIEFDRRNGGAWADISHWLQFCQWTIAVVPRHPVFRKMTRRVVWSMEDLSRKHNVTVDQLKPGSFEVMNSTGPAAWTDVVFEQLQEFDPTLNTTKDLSFMTEPKLYGDILVLTIDGFGMGQVHSHSTHDGSIPEAALIKHWFRGSWRGS